MRDAMLLLRWPIAHLRKLGRHPRSTEVEHRQRVKAVVWIITKRHPIIRGAIAMASLRLSAPTPVLSVCITGASCPRAYEHVVEVPFTAPCHWPKALSLLAF